MRSCLAVLAISVLGCGSDSRDDAPSPRAEPVPVVAPTPVAEPLDLSLGTSWQMAHPIRDGRISVVPIVATGPVDASTHYLTLADGLSRHVVTLREMGRNDAFVADTVRIKNTSRQPLFVMSGEIILDGLQDRAIAEDRVIPAGKTVRVAVRCVEMGREAGNLSFSSGKAIVEDALRQAIAYESQTDVWNKIIAINQRLGLAPPTKTYRLAAALQTNLAASQRRERLASAIAALPDHDRVVGMAQVIDGEVMSIDRFATPELFAALESELLGSYIASDGAIPHEGRTFLPRDVRALAADPAAHDTAASFVALRR